MRAREIAVTEDEKAVRIVMELDEKVKETQADDTSETATTNGTMGRPLEPQRTITNTTTTTRQSVIINAVGSRLSFMPGPSSSLQMPGQPTQPPPTRMSMRLPTTERSRVMRISYIV